MPRCDWAKSELMIPYHDTEWGVPCHDDRLLFEHLVLDSAQAGLSWEIVLRKREAYRAAFRGFEIATVARFGARQLEKLLVNPELIRNRQKMTAAIAAARGVLALQEEFGAFDAYLWRFVEGRPIVNRWRRMDQIPTTRAEAQALSRDLKQRGFNFVGPTIIYAFMQAVGMVNDHVVSCPRHKEVGRGGG